MADVVYVYWRDIPSQIILRESRREQYKRLLSERFEKAIDQAAMRSKQHGTEDYLALWRKTAPRPVADIEAEIRDQEGENREENREESQEDTRNALLDRLQRAMEAAYPPERLRELVQQGGLEKKTEPDS